MVCHPGRLFAEAPQAEAAAEADVEFVDGVVTPMPCLLHLDSLRCHSTMRIAKTLREYVGASPCVCSLLSDWVLCAVLCSTVCCSVGRFVVVLGVFFLCARVCVCREGEGWKGHDRVIGSGVEAPMVACVSYSANEHHYLV